MTLSRTTLGLAVVGALSGAASAATADPAFDAFQQLCIATGAEYPAVASAADSSGWKPIEVTVPTMKGVVVSDKLTRGRAVGGGDATLSAWRGVTATNVGVSICTVQASKATFGAAEASAQTWAGFAPQDSKEDKAIFRFTDIAAGHRAVAAADYDSAAAGSGMYLLTVTGGAGGVNLDLLKIKK